jgi:trigger factor
MNITRENIDELNGKIRVSIEKADYETNVETVLKEHRKKAQIPGFRPGKVPQGLIRKMYGKSAMVEEVNKLLTQKLSQYLVEEKLNILGEPLPCENDQSPIDWDNDTDFEFLFDIGFAPEVELTLNKKSTYTQYTVAVDDTMIDQQIDNYCNRFGENQPGDSVTEKSTLRGNIVELDAEGNIKEEGASADMSLISIDIIKDADIKASFIGKVIDDEVIFDMKKAYPNDTEIAYLLNIDKEAAAAIDSNFKITIKEINNFVAAEVNEDLFKKIYGDDTTITDVKAFREKAAEEIKAAYIPSSEYKFAEDARESLTSKSDIKFPVEFLKRWLKATNKELTDDQIEKDFEPFTADLKWQIIKENIAKENEIKVEETEVIELAKEVATAQFRQYGMFDVPAEHLDGFVHQMLSKEEDRNRLFTKKMEEKIMLVIKSKVKVAEKELSKEEFDKLFEK